MSRVVVLDSSPVSLLSAKVKPTGDTGECARWLARLLAASVRVVIPEVADYEVRRELVRGGKLASVRRLDRLAVTLKYVPITTATMREAADLWAAARNAGLPTADPHALDGDVILAAQAILLGEPEFVVATTNVNHLGRYVPAAEWRTIVP